MDFQVLGPLRVANDGAPVYLGTARKPRLVLAAMLASPGWAASVAWLIDVVWDGRPPASARRNLHQYVHRLRAGLGAEVLMSRQDGYALAIDGRLDAERFGKLTDRGQAALAAGDPESAVRDLRAALDLWRGPAFAEFADCAPIAAEAGRLERLRVDTQGSWAEAALALGQYAVVVCELTDLVRANPYREDLVGRLMVALHRVGRQGEALDLFRATRTVLRDDLGVEPGPALQQLHGTMLRGDAVVAPPLVVTGPRTGAGSHPPPAPRELPADVTAFIGRDAALRMLDALLPEARGEHNSAAVAALVGVAGIGKTALAVHWAHQVAGWFPDGNLFINLRGHGAGPPLQPIDALARLLRALGMAPDRIPVDIAEAAASYRSLTAGKRLLVVLDNAATAEQVRPLLPGGRDCVVVVTSRDRLTGLLARDATLRLTMDVLSAAEAGQLLGHMIGGERVRGEPEASRQLAELCSRLPLALRIAGASLADQPHDRIADHVTRLVADPIGELAIVGDQDGSAVRHAFDSSYRNLREQTRLVFRRLGLVGCHDFTRVLAAVLAGIPEQEAAVELERLAANHLIDRQQPGRYSLHDLLRHYAHSLGHTEDSEADRAAAVRRFCDHYLAAASAAVRLVCPELVRFDTAVAPLRPPGVHDYASALRWLDTERHNLLATIRHAAHYGPAETAWLLADELRDYFELRRHMVDWIAAARAALAAARASGNRHARVVTLYGMAQLDFCLGRHGRAINKLNRTIALRAPGGPAQLEATLHSNLGILLASTGRSDEAIEQFTRAAELAEGMVLAKVLRNLANLHREAGRLTEARRTARHALELARRTRSSRNIASSASVAGQIDRELGRFDSALGHLTESLNRHRALSYANGEGDALGVLALVCRDTGHVDEAQRHAERSLRTAQDVGNRLAEATASNTLGAVCLAADELRRATYLHQRALRLAEDVPSPVEIGEAMIGLATVNHHAGDHWTAIRYANEALGRVRPAGLRVLEGRALTVSAAAHLALDRPAEAGDFGNRALGLHRQTGHRLGEAQTHMVLARADPTHGVAHEARARGLYDKLHLPMPEMSLAGR